MEPIPSRPDPPDARAVWARGPGQKTRLSPHSLLLTAVLLVPMTLTATLGTISFSSADGTAIVSFWPAAAFQVVFSIWFGVYGALAGIIGPMLGNGLVGASPFLFIPANTIQCCLAGLWFRYRKLDPRLRSGRDWLGLIFIGVVMGNALGAFAGVAESQLRSLASGEPGAGLDFWVGKLFTWFSGNSVPSLFLAPALLLAASPMIVRGSLFCRSFWGSREVIPRPKLRFRFSDIPMIGKLMLLTLVAGVLPLLLVAAWSVWGSVKIADRQASEINRQAVRQIRNETERHELVLRLWAGQLDSPDLDEKAREELLAGWRSIPETFERLEIVEPARIEAEMPAAMLPAFEEREIVFYRVLDEEIGEARLRGAFRLASARNKALTGIVVWREDGPLIEQGPGVAAVLVLDEDGNELYREATGELSDWLPGERGRGNELYTVRHGGRIWHVAEASAARLGWRFITLTSAQAGIAAGLSNIPNPVAVLINLAIFGSLIAGSAIAQRISRRMLAIAERVREAGGEPGKLQVPVQGRDELGYLAETLNRMSSELEVSVRRLRETTAEKERLAAEMELARQVQRSVLPARPPQVQGYEFAAVCRPAREVGGDFFDFFVGDDGNVVMMIGDAVGKGLRAAMFMTEAHAIAHAAALHLSVPGGILTAVNSTMLSARSTSGDFVTMLCAVLQPQRHRLLYSSAGHLPPILLRDGETEDLELGGPPLAILPKIDYGLHRIELVPGDAVIAYTDGVTDAANPSDHRFGVERLGAVARRHAGRTAGEILDAVLAAIREFSGPAPQSDDITLLVVRRRE